MLPLAYEAKLPYGAEKGPSKEDIFYHSKATVLCCIFFKKYCIYWETKYIFRFIQFFFQKCPYLSCLQSVVWQVRGMDWLNFFSNSVAGH